MANKVTKTSRSPALGVKIAAPAAIMVATTKAVMTKKDEEDQRTIVSDLRSELDAERRMVRQLRREKDAEVQKVRNEEQTKMSIALKDQAQKLLQEKQKEAELQRETMKSKHDSDVIKIVKLKDREISKLRGDLARCQDELKEELSKRGMSTSARANFDTERQKLLQEVRDLQLAKRQLEERLTEAEETEKRLQLEIRRLQDSCKVEVARVEREANIEVKKLLDELKTKDHMLAQMDRSIYPDRATIIKNRLEKLSIEEMLNLKSISSCSNHDSCISNSSSCSIESSNYKASDISSSNGDNVNKCKSNEKSSRVSCGPRSNSYGRSSNHLRSNSGIRKRSRSASILGRSSKESSKIDGSNISMSSSGSSSRPASAASITSSLAEQCVTSSGCALQTVNLQRKLYEAEKRMKLAEGLQRAVVDKNNTLSANNKQLESKIKSLNQQVSDTKTQQESNEKEIRRLNKIIVSMKSSQACGGEEGLNSELEFCRQRCVELEQVLTNLRQECQAKDHRIGLLIKSQLKPRHKYERKTVRFLLPDDIEEKTSETSEDDTFSSSSCGDPPIQSDELLIQSVHKDYESLMEEHLKLQKYCAKILQSHSIKNDIVKQVLHVKGESVDVAIRAAEEKVRLAEERELRLKHQLQEVYDQNEELEFRVLELEEFAEKNKSALSPDDLASRNRELESEVEVLRLRLAQQESLDLLELEKDASTPYQREMTCLGDHQRLSVENLRKHSGSLEDSDEENQMVQSFSTMTSGFDEISELDDRTEMPDMPVEEEADLERDADDLGPDMPTEECYEIPADSSYRSDDYASRNSGEIMTLALDSEEMLSDNSDVFIKQHHDSQSDSVVQDGIVDSDSRPKRLTTERNISLSEQIVNNPSNETTLGSGVKSQKIMNLEDQVEILELVDSTYKMTIDSLCLIEQQLQSIIPSNFSEVEKANVDEFWSAANSDIECNIAILDQEIAYSEIPEFDSSQVNDSKLESQDLIAHSYTILQGKNKVLQEEKAAFQNLEQRIEALENESSAEDKYESIEDKFNSRDISVISDSSVKETCIQSNGAGLLGSLKRLAFDVVAASFRTEFFELNSLTHEFFASTEEDELKDIAFIDEDEAVCVQLESSSAAELEIPSQLQLRTELRLNTKMSTLNQRFDFMSPTTFDNPDWSNSSHLETINHCLLLQMDELERERDSLKDIVCRDDSVIHEMTQQIASLQISEQELKKLVSKFELTEEQAAENIDKLAAECHDLRTKLRRAESVETSLRVEMNSIGKRESEMETRLLRSVESLENTTAKLRNNLSEVEKEKIDAVKQAEELNSIIVSLQQKETTMLQRIKLFENLSQNLKEKNRDLEFSLSSAYDEVSNMTGQKDSLVQRLQSLTDENEYLVNENNELLVEKKELAAEVEKLTESENFLKEANRKMWLSLQANIEEREASSVKCCQFCKRTADDTNFCQSEKSENSTSVDSVDGSIFEDNSVQTDEYQNCKHQTSARANGSTIVNFLSTLVFSRDILRSRRVVRAPTVKGSVETERKAIFEEMLKFVASTRLRRSANDLSVTTTTKPAQEPKLITSDKASDSDVDASELDPVESEEEFWSVVEKYEDIYDVRAADTWNLWRHLELDIMGLNLDDLRKLVAEREDDKSCQASSTDLPVSSVEQSTQCESQDEQTSRQGELPPLPTSLPPREDNLTSCVVISCLEQGTQTEVKEKLPISPSKPEEDLASLRHLLNQNERTLIARKNEVDRLTVEMRSWQQRALDANDQISRLTTELSSAQQIIESTKGRTLPEYQTQSSVDSKLQQSTTRKSRIELPSSQIPVSVKRAVDFYSAISQRSASTSPAPAQASQRPAWASPGPAQTSTRHAETSPGPVLTSQRSLTVSSGASQGSPARTISQIPKPAPGSPRVEGRPTAQGPLSNGSSFSEQQQLSSSQIPRLLPEWIQQLREQQSRTDEMSTAVHDESDESVAASRVSLQQLPQATAVTSSAVAASGAAAAETEMPGSLPSDDIIDDEGRDF